MANISDDNPHDLGPGILQPQLQHNFLLKFGLPKDLRDQISRETVRVCLDYVNNNATVEIEQPLVGGALHEVLFDYVKNGSSMRIIAPNGDGSPAYILQLVGLKCIKHTFDLDYAKSGAAKHEMTFNFSSLSMLDPERYHKELREVKNNA